MPKPRKQQISLAVTPYYHCMSRCVRRAFLCGKDPLTGHCFEHRRGWIEDKAISIAQTFAINIAAYAIMSNHYHLVLFVDSEQAESWSHTEVLQRWHRLFRGNALSQKFLNQKSLSEGERNRLVIYAEACRQRLMDISWFMRTLNEYIARKANKEDCCTGSFWEGRFKSQALLDESALFACLAYVDLNPIRAGAAKTPEESEYTSIKQRCHIAKQSHQPNHINAQHQELHPFVGSQQQPINNQEQKTKRTIKGIPISLTSYLELVEWTGHIQRTDKLSLIPKKSHSILNRLGLNTKQWLTISQCFEQSFKQFAGKEANVREAAKQLDYRRPSGISLCRQHVG